MSGAGRFRRPARRRMAFVQPSPGRLHRLRVFAALLGLSLTLTLVAAVVLPRVLDWGQYRAAVEAVASAGLGRPVRIAGPIRLSLLPEATLVAGDVTLADLGHGASASASQLRLRVALGPLLAGRIEPQDLVLRRAHLRLPWPLAAPVSLGLAPAAGLHARVEDGTLAVGGLEVTAVNGELRVDPATGSLAAAGVAAVMGRTWQMTGRLGRPGADGAATIELTLDGQGAAVGTGGRLSGQIAADGSLAGRIAGRGADLSLLLTAPALAWRADGAVRAHGGLAVADDLELDLGGSPARGAVALRLAPQLRLDAALETSRLDLGAWLPPLLHGGPPALPTGVELSADSASLAGGLLRRLRTGFEIGSDGLVLREADAELPGRASLHLSGRLAAARFTGEARITAADVPQTLAWLRPTAPALIDALPPAAWQAATLAASVTADSGGVALSGMSGTADGVPVAGDLAFRLGPRPAVAATLRLAGPVLDRWLPQAPASLTDAADRVGAWPRRFAGFDADLSIAASTPVWRGVTFDRLDLQARCNGGAVELRRATLNGRDAALSLTGTLSAAGRADGRLDWSLEHAETLAPSLPEDWVGARALFQGPATVGLTVSGQPNALATTGAVALSDARLQANGTLDLPGRHWRGTASLHHPGANRLLAMLGLGDTVDWLGDGSLSLQTTADAAPESLVLTGLQLSAGALRAAADLKVTGTGHPTITGSVDADTLPVPVLVAGSSQPWGLAALHGADAKLGVRAARLLWGTAPLAENAVATVTLHDGVLRAESVAGRVSGGTMAGQISLADASPPRLAVSGTLNGVGLDGPVAGTPIDLSAGRLDAAFTVSGAGYSPAGLLATLSGPVKFSVQHGVLDGLDAGRVFGALPPQGALPDAATVLGEVTAGLRSGATPFDRLELEGTMSGGTMTLARGAVTLPGGSIAASGTLDVPEQAIDAGLALRPALETAPAIGLRVIGPVAAPSDAPELTELTRWLTER